MTLDEWEAKKSTPSFSHSAAVSDEELAIRLQEQFNMEDSHVSTVDFAIPKAAKKLFVYESENDLFV